MLNPAIYRTIFNLDKDRKDLPAGNPAVPYPGAVLADGGEDDLPKNPTTDIKPYLPVPKPPTSRSAEQQPEIVPVQETAEESVTIDEEPASAGISEDPSTEMIESPAVTEATAAAARKSSSPKRTVTDYEREGVEKGYSGPTQGAFVDKQKTRNADRSQLLGLDVTSGPAAATMGTERLAQQDRASDQASQAARIQGQAEEALKGTLTPKQQRRIDSNNKYNEELKAALTYENPTTPAEKKQNRLDELKFKAENPRNEDHGIKGFIKETLQNFFFGLSKAGGVPGISMGQALMLGGAGAGAGMLNRGWNEQRMAEDQLGGAQQDLEMAESRADKNRALGIKEQEQVRREQADLDKVDHWNRSLAVKEEYQKEYFQLQENRAIAKAAFDKDRSTQNKRRLDQIDERMGWIRQQDKIKNAQADRRLDQIDQKGKTNTKPGTAPAAAPTPAQARATLAVVQAQYDAAVAAGDPNAKVIKQRIEKFKSLHKIK